MLSAGAQTTIKISDDVKDFPSTETQENVRVEYFRSFKHTNWQPLFVPFDVKISDLNGQFEVAELAVRSKDEFEEDDMQDLVTSRRLKVGETLTAGNIAIIRSLTTGVKTLTFPSTTMRPWSGGEKKVKVGGDTCTYTFYCTIQKIGNLSGNLVKNQGKLDIASNKLILGAFRWCIVSNQSMAAQGLTLVVDERGAVTGIGFARSNE